MSLNVKEKNPKCRPDNRRQRRGWSLLIGIIPPLNQQNVSVWYYTKTQSAYIQIHKIRVAIFFGFPQQ
jgi:hypothetical protein